MNLQLRHVVPVLSLIGILARPAPGPAQSFVEYPAHPATYGDHSIAAAWAGGPTAVTVLFESDEAILHGDGIGQSQRTARNTLNFTAPSSPANPQDYDELRVIGTYGTRLPLLQQMSANGTSTLRFSFASPVTTGFDLFITDVDTSDSLIVSALGPGGPLDMTDWNLLAEGDLSLYKNTGAGYSGVVAPAPATLFTTSGIIVVAATNQNYNRSFTILRAPAGEAVQSVSMVFTGIQNSARRAEGGTGAHIYAALSTPAPVTGVPLTPSRPDFTVAPNPTRGPVTISCVLDLPADVRVDVFDVGGRLVRNVTDGFHGPGRQEMTWSGDDRFGSPVAPGLYFVRLHVAGSGPWTRRVTVAP